MSLDNDANSAWVRIQRIDAKTDDLLLAVMGLFRSVEMLTHLLQSLHDKNDVLIDRAESRDP